MNDEMEVRLTVNGVERAVRTQPSKSLLRMLREDLGLTGAKEGCGQGDCGSCIVVVDGLAVNSCLMLAPQAQDTEVTTLEGIAEGTQLHPLQQHFREKWAFQCGYCTPGMLMSAYALLLRTHSPSTAQIKEAIEGNLCRCTSYRTIIESIGAAAAELRERAAEPCAPQPAFPSPTERLPQEHAGDP
jgi:carbon-monoxide dehydrogenase small subunit